MNEIIFVSIGGFFGAISRFIISNRIQNRNKSAFPAGTLMVNLIGAFLLGILIGIHIMGHLYALLGIGFMGAFTTFSTFKLEADKLRKLKKNKLFYAYIAISYIAGIFLAFCGIMLGKMV